MHGNGSELDGLRYQATALVAHFSDPARRADLARRQRDRVLELVGDFDGASAVAAVVADALNLEATPCS